MLMSTEIHMCPGCGTSDYPVFIAMLGELTWMRCRACGIDFSIRDV